MKLKLMYGNVDETRKVLQSDPCAKIFQAETSKYGETLSIQDAEAVIEYFKAWMTAIKSNNETN